MAELQNCRKERSKVAKFVAFPFCNPAILQFCNLYEGGNDGRD
jgi:hypothetical protein